MPKKKEEITESDAKKEFRKHIEAYKIAHPEKYETKKEALEAKLETL